MPDQKWWGMKPASHDLWHSSLSGPPILGTWVDTNRASRIRRSAVASVIFKFGRKAKSFTVKARIRIARWGRLVGVFWAGALFE